MPDIFDKYSHGRPDIEPIIYAYSDVNYPGCLKVGDTTREIEKKNERTLSHSSSDREAPLYG